MEVIDELHIGCTKEVGISGDRGDSVEHRRIYMPRKVKITCRYFQVKRYTEDGNADERYNLLEWLNSIADMTLAERTKQIGQTKGRLDEITKRDSFYALNFVRMESYSSTYIVTEEESAKHVDISIDNEEYIGKNTVVIYDAERDEIMLMGNQGGFSAHTITSYINSFFENPVCVLEPVIIRKDFVNLRNKYGKIKLTISNVNDYIPTPGSAYEDVLTNARNMGATTMSFEFSTGRKKGLNLEADVVRTIISDAFSNIGAVSVARVKMEDEEGTAVYNLFENVKHSVITLEADSKGEIAYKVIADAMVGAYR